MPRRPRAGQEARTARGLPRARRQGILRREVGEDLVIYDLDSHRAHSLDRKARRLLEFCDGETSIETLCQASPFDEPDRARVWVVAGLERLAGAGLLENDWQVPAFDRRRLLKGLVGLPVVLSVLVPGPAAAQSGLPNGSPCSSSSQCASGCCNVSGRCAPAAFCF